MPGSAQWLAAALCSASLCGALAGETSQGQLRPFTIRDSIELTRIAVSEGGDPLVMSPDGSSFAMVTWQGNIEGDTVDYVLLHWSTDELKRRLLAGDRRMPAPRVLGKFH